jgi:hypothetical protein
MTSGRSASPPPSPSIEVEPPGPELAEASTPIQTTGSASVASPQAPVVPPEAPTPRRSSASRSRVDPHADREGNERRGSARSRRPAADYATTRLVNFRLPVDLHDRFKDLVRDAEREYPRLRHPSLTELLIALLEEGPETVDEVADLIRRKRAGEHEADLHRSGSARLGRRPARRSP